MSNLIKTQNELGVSKTMDFDTMQRMANVFANSTIVPNNFQVAKIGKEIAIANSFIAVNMAVRLNADPFMIMQNLYIVQGKPSFSSSFLIATVNSCGRFEPIKFSKIEQKGEAEYMGRKIPNLTCFAYTTEKGKEDKLVGTEISIDMAIREGWYGKTGSKWQTIPEQMLKYRAAAFWARAYCPEISMGLHTTEEVKDIQEVSYQEIIPENANKGQVIDIEEEEKESSQQQTVQQKPNVFNR